MKQSNIDFSKWCVGLTPRASTEIKYLDLTVKPKPQNFLFAHGGNGICALGNLQILKGEEKTGKSAFGALLAVSALRGEFLGVSTKEECTPVLWIDTEQDTNTILSRIEAVLDEANEPINTDRLKVLSTKMYDAPGKALNATIQAMKETGARFVFLDGLVDLCEDSNGNKESVFTVAKLLQVAEETGSAIMAIIHENPGNGHEEKKARGHLGTKAQQKASEVYRIEKTGNVAKIYSTRYRFGADDSVTLGFEFADNFRIKYADMREAAQIDREDKELKELFAPIFADRKNQSRADIKRALIGLKNTSDSTAGRKIKRALERGILGQNGRNYYLLANDFANVDLDDEEDFL